LKIPAATQQVISEYTDGTDYFLRTNGDDIDSDVEFDNIQGSYYFAAQDIDGDGASIPASITIEDVDISSQGNLEFSIYIAEDDDGSQQDWDDLDYLHIDYDIDNSGIFTDLIHVEGSNSLDTEPKIDTNFDGTGNGTAITNTFTKFTATIPGTGSTIDIKITFNLGDDQEDIAIDNIQLRPAIEKYETVSNSPTFFKENPLSYSKYDDEDLGDTYYRRDILNIFNVDFNNNMTYNYIDCDSDNKGVTDNDKKKN